MIKIEKVKDSVKSQKFYNSFPANIKVIGVQELVPAVIKTYNLTSFKLNCPTDIMLEDIIDISAKTDKVSRIACKGRVVRKNRLSNTYEYGIEITELPESSSKVLHFLITRFELGN